MDEEAEQQLTAQLSGGQQQLDATVTTASSPASNQQQRRSLASLLSIKREPKRPKTPSVVVTDETTHLVSPFRKK
jgi:energy-coupling factor transporter ATP-binding protein EcfA2